MRDLSKILLELKKLEPCVNNLLETLPPKFCDKIVKVAKLVSKYITNIYIPPTFALNIAVFDPHDNK